MDIVQIVAVGLVAAILAITLKSHAPEMALMISIGASVLIFVMVLPEFHTMLDVLKQAGAKVDADMRYVGIVFKIVGIAYIAEFGAQLCADAGESAIASKIEIGAKMLIMVVSIPILNGVLELITTMLP